MKFGIYQDFGNYTCAGYPGILGYLENDANTFASWDVDFVKLDGCYSHPLEMDNGYPEFGYYLNLTGRPMLYSCSWPVYQIYAGMQPNYTAIVHHCNMWRNFDDIQDSWASVESIIDYYGNNQDAIVPNAGPGHWNDPDMVSESQLMHVLSCFVHKRDLTFKIFLNLTLRSVFLCLVNY